MNSQRDFLKDDILISSPGGLSNDESSHLDDNNHLSSSFEISSLDLDVDIGPIKSSINKNRKRQEIEIKQLKHDLQLSKIELGQREFQLNNVRHEYQNRYEILQEKVNHLTHQNQLLTAQLNSLNAIHQEEMRQKQEQIKLELNRILIRQKELEENNERLMKHESEIKKDIRHIDTVNWTDEEYEFMTRRDEDLLTIKEFAALKLYKTIKPLKQRLDESLKRIEELEERIKVDKSEYKSLKKTYEEERKSYNINSVDNQKLYYELADCKAQLQQANFKKDNYDRVKFERDDYEKKYNDSEAKITKHLATIQVMSKERDGLDRDINQLKQEISLLRQDKDYLQKQYVEAQAKYKSIEEKLDQTERLLNDTKRTKDELQERYMNTRELFKSEYEDKLAVELAQMKLRMGEEMEKLRENTRQFYERELASAKETRDSARDDKRRLELNEHEANVKMQEALEQLRLVQVTCEAKLAEMRNELKIKQFELERARLLSEENVVNYQKALVENEKLNKKIKVIQNEFYNIQLVNDKKILEIENELNDKKNRLESYENVEREMDSVIRQVAESSEKGEMNEADAEKLLLQYGYGANIMLSSKRRIQQNVHLTKRVLHLEQISTSLRLELNKERAAHKDLLDQLEVAKNVIDNTKQPHEFLLRSIQGKELQLKRQQSVIDSLKTKIDELSTEKESLVRKQNEMKIDIEKLLRNNQELFYIRDELKKSGHLLHNKQVAQPRLFHMNRSNPNLDVAEHDNPMPLMFTSRDQIRSPFQQQSPSSRRKIYSIQND